MADGLFGQTVGYWTKEYLTDEFGDSQYENPIISARFSAGGNPYNDIYITFMTVSENLAAFIHGGKSSLKIKYYNTGKVVELKAAYTDPHGNDYYDINDTQLILQALRGNSTISHQRWAEYHYVSDAFKIAEDTKIDAALRQLLNYNTGYHSSNGKVKASTIDWTGRYQIEGGIYREISTSVRIKLNKQGTQYVGNIHINISDRGVLNGTISAVHSGDGLIVKLLNFSTKNGELGINDFLKKDYQQTKGSSIFKLSFGDGEFDVTPMGSMYKLMDDYSGYSINKIQ